MERTEGNLKNRPFQLGKTRVDPQANVLYGPSGETTVEPKVMAVLVRLAEARGEVVEREAFTSTIWAREYGGDASLTRAVSLLRKALGEGQDGAVYIDTIPRKGYRLNVAQSSPQTPASRGFWRRADVWLAALFLVVLLVFLWRMGSDRQQATQPDLDPVVAVLPFLSRSDETSHRHLAEGLADEVITTLIRGGTLDVIAGSSSFRFQEPEEQDLARLAEQLNASHVLQGSVQPMGRDLRIRVSLTEIATGRVSWSESLTRPVVEVFDTADTIANGVLLALGRHPSRGASNFMPDNPAIVSKYLEARALMREDIGRSERIFSLLEEVVDQEPGFAKAWADLAIMRLNIMFARPGSQTSGQRNRDPEERLFRVRTEAQKALALDSHLPEARLALAVVDYRARLLPLGQAERQFRQIADDNPYYTDAQIRLGLMLVEMGYLEEALHHFRRAWDLDPLSLTPASFYLQFALEVGETAEAEDLLYRGRFPWFRNSFLYLYYALIENDNAAAAGWLEEAREAGQFSYHGAFSTSSPDPEKFNRLVNLFHRLIEVASTDTAESNPDLSEAFIRAADDGLILHYYAAIMLAAAGYQDSVFELVERRLKTDDLYFRGALFRRAFQSLREDPRVMAWFDVGTQLDHWLQTQRWPDFCRDPSLPYDCREEARKFRDLLAE
jgi:TolB-like protein/DNA-binding winged helix-turn-helix (wHTH) protein/tetratricopeptide (TPR) repeat protein